MNLQLPRVVSAPATSPEQVQLLHLAGQGNWHAYTDSLKLDLAALLQIAESWAPKFAGVDRPWLCWNVEDDWCLAQQRLVRSVGWTPVIGFDPRVGPPKKTVQGAIVIDFNEHIGLPVMYPHFPMELLFKFADRLAFWHSDLLIRRPLMQRLAEDFAHLPDGATIVMPNPIGLRDWFKLSKQRYWELVGCTTRGASERQFKDGCGWWMAFHSHPNLTPAEQEKIKKRYYWDHGAGIYYWHKKKHGDVRLIRDRAIHEGHFTKIGKTDYKRSVLVGTSDAQRSMQREIVDNFSLEAACRQLDLQDLIE